MKTKQPLRPSVRKSGNAVRRMWEGGPLRQWSEKRESSKWIPYAAGGYVAQYVCDQCRRPSQGVYRAISPGKWLCGPCKQRERTHSRGTGHAAAAAVAVEQAGCGGAE